MQLRGRKAFLFTPLDELFEPFGRVWHDFTFSPRAFGFEQQTAVEFGLGYVNTDEVHDILFIQEEKERRQLACFPCTFRVWPLATVQHRVGKKGERRLALALRHTVNAVRADTSFFFPRQRELPSANIKIQGWVER